MSQQDKTFMNAFIGVMVGLVVLFFIIYFTAQIIVGDPYSESAKQDPILQKQIAEAVKPVGSVAVAPAKKVEVQDSKPAAGVAKIPSSAKIDAAVKQVPVAAVQGAAGDASEKETAIDGKQIYASACFACHGTGAAGAPKLGDQAAWAPRIAQGQETLLTNALKGLNAMPPKGGRLDLADESIKAAVDYMVAESN